MQSPGALSQQEPVSPLVAAGRSVGTTPPWFVFVPSIVFRWAEANLQEAISEGKRGNDWRLEDHLLLIDRVLQGIDALHSKRAIHADVRPANVMSLGPPSEAANYVLGDYGSLSSRQPGLGEGHSGGTLMGPRIGSERHSPFYSQERGTALELESADTAILLRRDSAFLLLLGWHKSLIDDSGSPREEKVQKLHDLDLDARDDSDPAESVDRLQPGDRLRLRDMVFTVVRETESGGDRILVCDGLIHRVFHGHLVIPDYGQSATQETVSVLRIPSVIEMKKWSVATDLYGVGALALYTVFRGRADENAQRHPARPDIEFSEMIRHFESRTYFHSIWSELDSVCAELDALARKYKDVAGGGIALGVLLDEQPDVDATGGSDQPADVRTLRMRTRDVAGSLTRSVPGLKRVWIGMDCNLPHFVLFIHFVLCCLHRRSHLRKSRPGVGDVLASSSALETRIEGGGPFCVDRLQDPESDGPAARALKRIRVLRNFVQRNILGGVESDAKSIPDYQDPLETPKLHMANVKLNEQLAHARKESQAELEVLRRDLALAQKDLTDTEAQLALLRDGAQELGVYLIPQKRKELPNVVIDYLKKVNDTLQAGKRPEVNVGR
jgi:hypothetical protein